MNQGKLEVLKQEMARLNIDILGISELKWTGMGEFNSDFGDFPRGSVDKDPPSNAGDPGLTPGWGTKTLDAMQ